jgi:hypothetical protein
MTTADHIYLTAQRIREESRLMAAKPKLVRIPPPIRCESTIHDTLQAHPELISEPWVQRVLDMYQEALQNRVL